MNKSTKIIATIGPASEELGIIKKMIKAGMNVARFNTKHGTPEWHKERIERVHQAAQELKVSIGVMLDLQGPEIRIDLPSQGSVDLEAGDTIVFTAKADKKKPNQPVIPQIVIDGLKVGNRILVDDGLGEFEVVAHHKSRLEAKAINSFKMGHRKTLNTPGVTVELPSLIKQDFVHLDAATNKLIDFVGLSFVRNAKDIEILRRELKKRKLTADIVAKVENQSALDNLDDIIEAADAVMIARGDLAVEVPFEELTFWQKQIIQRCRESGKPVITATQMLKSMVEHPRPTRAEVSDVAHAIYDGTDAVMLSEETTIGKYPVKAVATQAKIADFNEDHTCFMPIQPRYRGASSYVTRAAVGLVEDAFLSAGDIKIDKIVCLTETGTTAKLTTRFRPHVPVYALTSNPQTYRQLSLLYDVTPFMIKLPKGDKLESSSRLLDQLKDLGLAEVGEHLLVIHGTFWKEPGLTNTMTLIRVKN